MGNWYLIFLVALAEAFFISLILTYAMGLLAIRLNIVDNPGERKVHKAPVPLLGGVAIFLTFNLVIGLNLLLLEPAQALGFDWIKTQVLPFLGENTWRPLVGVFAGGLVIFLLGVVDDIKALSPEIKLVGQIVAALILVLSGIRLELFIAPVLESLPIIQNFSEITLTKIQFGVSACITIFWVVMMTNSMNLLDNMDGLCGGITAISALSFFLCLLPSEEYFLCTLLMVFCGSVTGFLYHNLAPARIFMGDAGAMFCGYLLSTAAVMGTFFYTESDSTGVAVIAPLLALCVPIFDTLSVVWIRWKNGESIMKGDKRHFSHRLVDQGMSERQAVEFIYLVAAITGLGGALLVQLNSFGTVILLLQTIGLFLLIILLMKAKILTKQD
jgi:UDP-GlcNAc:undecaprenyl-phosphate GlcNAc-1-phosphate transferase